MPSKRGKIGNLILEVSSKRLPQQTLEGYVGTIEFFYSELGLIPVVGDVLELNRRDQTRVIGREFNWREGTVHIEVES